MKNATARFSEEQKVYMAAKALVAALDAQAKREFTQPSPERGAPEAEWEAYFEAKDSYLEGIGYYAAKDAMIQAERSLFAWASSTIKSDPKLGMRFGEIAVVFEKAPLNPAHRAKLVDLCMRFAA